MAHVFQGDTSCKSQDLQVFIHSWIRKWKYLLQKTSETRWLVAMGYISITDERTLGGTVYIFKSIDTSSPSKITLLSVQELFAVTESSSSSLTSWSNHISHIPLPKRVREYGANVRLFYSTLPGTLLHVPVLLKWHKGGL